MKQKTKEHIKSAAITFLTGFCMVLVTDWDKLSLQAVMDGSYLGIVFMAVRAGFKELIEAFINWRAGK